MRALLAATLLCVVIPAASAELYNEELVCRAPADELSATETLRALSLDLRGTLPTVAEMEAVDAWGEVPETLIDKYLDSDEFLEVAVRFHKALFWPNLEGLRLVNRGMDLRRENATGLYYRDVAAQRYRGERVPCRDVEEPDPTLKTIIKVPMEDGTEREGYVWREAYWNPGVQIKVCAYDAQDNWESSNGVECKSRNGPQRDDCGCGPDLIWCGYQNQNLIRRALEQDLHERVKEIIGEDRSYLDLLSNTSMHVNGTLVHYYRHLAVANTSFPMTPFAVPEAYLPELDYNDVDTWRKVALPDHHAGVLTSPAYLLRFQTNRSRANQFWTKFVCEPFQPPPGGLPEAKDGEALDPDLQSRSGCKFCHAILEPGASYWGRWPESGTGYLNQALYPAFDEDCASCAVKGGCSSQCNSYYVVNALSPKETEYFGWLKPYLFRHDAHLANVEEGPHLLVKRVAQDERLPVCMARRAVGWLWGRNVTESEQGILGELAQSFMMKGYNFKELIKAVVTSPTYRRVR